MYYNIRDVRSQEINSSSTLLALIAKNHITNDDETFMWISKHVSESASNKYKHCGEYIIMDKNTTTGQEKISRLYSCNQGLCRNCSKRNAVKNGRCITAVCQRMVQEKKCMLYVTLTLPNVPKEELNDTIDLLNKSWTKLTRTQIKSSRYKNWNNYIKRLEVTYNQADDTYHAHLHALVFVTSSFYKKENYVSNAQLLTDWRKATGQQDITQVFIKCFKPTSINPDCIVKISRYTAKASDYCINEEVFDTFYKALYRKRKLVYTGMCKTYRDEYVKAVKSKKSSPSENEEHICKIIYHLASLENSNQYVEEARIAYKTSESKLGQDAFVEQKALEDAKAMAQKAMTPQQDTLFKDLMDSDDFNDLD